MNVIDAKQAKAITDKNSKDVVDKMMAVVMDAVAAAASSGRSCAYLPKSLVDEGEFSLRGLRAELERLGYKWNHYTPQQWDSQDKVSISISW